MKNIIYSTATVIALIVSVMYIGAQFSASYSESCKIERQQIKAKRKDLTLRAKWYQSLSEKQQDSVKRLIVSP